MADGIYSALSGAIAQTTRLEVTAANLANVSTAGYQRSTPVFREVLGGATGERSEGAPRFVAATASAIDVSAGAVRKTGRPLDAALPEGAYLAVETPRGERYTRAVSLESMADGTLVVSGGHAVLSEAGQPIRLTPGARAALSESGEVSVDGEVQTRLRIVRFAAPDALTREGGALLALTPAAGRPTAAQVTLTTEALEESNASPVQSMTELMTATRMFEAFQRAIEAFHEADRRVVTSVSSPT